MEKGRRRTSIESQHGVKDTPHRDPPHNPLNRYKTKAAKKTATIRDGKKIDIAKE